MVAQHGLHPVLEGGKGLRDRPPQRQHDKLDEIELELRLRRLRLQWIQAESLRDHEGLFCFYTHTTCMKVDIGSESRLSSASCLSRLGLQALGLRVSW